MILFRGTQMLHKSSNLVCKCKIKCRSFPFPGFFFFFKSNLMGRKLLGLWFQRANHSYLQLEGRINLEDDTER